MTMVSHHLVHASLTAAAACDQGLCRSSSSESLLPGDDDAWIIIPILLKIIMTVTVMMMMIMMRQALWCRPSDGDDYDYDDDDGLWRQSTARAGPQQHLGSFPPTAPTGDGWHHDPTPSSSSPSASRRARRKICAGNVGPPESKKGRSSHCTITSCTWSSPLAIDPAFNSSSCGREYVHRHTGSCCRCTQCNTPRQRRGTLEEGLVLRTSGLARSPCPRWSPSTSG